MKANGAVSILAVAVSLLATCTAWGRVIYVDDDAPTGGSGASWARAYRFLQDALAEADGSKPPVEVRVAQGIYKPDRSSAHPDGTGNRHASFILLDDVAIKGGFAGIGASDPDARDIALYETVLSGDLAGDDVPVLDPCDLLTEPTRADNSSAVVKAGACSRSTILDGFTITSGNAMGPRDRVGAGAGLYLSGAVDASCCPSVVDCTFSGNRSFSGGAIAVSSAYPEITACKFVQNAVVGEGGAMSILHAFRPLSSTCQFVIEGCTFSNNWAGDTGGAIRGWDLPSGIESCSFMRNHARMGGAIYADSSNEPVNTVNCQFIDNVADLAGGAIYFVYENGVNMTSCTLSGNVAPTGRAIGCIEPLRENSPAPSAVITNTILWDGGDEIGISEHVLVDTTYSDVQGNWPGEGNIDSEPLFASQAYWDPNGTPNDPNDDFFVEGDHHLKSQAGRWDPNSQSWVQDDVTSPCIDAGDPNSPIGDEPFPNGGRINMGAYGGTTEASKSYFGESLPEMIVRYCE
ncbi:MAG: right-handed parallel beta-helix repeat-containing protein [Phycisphaerales bacterium]